MLEVGEVGLASDRIDGDADEPLDEGAPLADEPGQPVAGEEVLPGLVVLAFADAEHGPGGE